MQIDFYQLSSTPIERVLPRIAERVLEAGGRLLVVTGDEAQAAALDRALWTYAPESFLPHSRAGAGGEAEQPVLIAPACDAPNRARNIALVDGEWREEALSFDRAFHFFDDATLEGARTAWRALKGRDGVEPRYWRQEDGRWRHVA